ncbi:MAG: efflux RND transporter periplasmic adaptor subunit [Candidatus Omnitrophica bacterium]|nr:efflux RND transporter periplasmic adaptor subunit [Candidatus Omnitrophota bacterium]
MKWELFPILYGSASTLKIENMSDSLDVRVITQPVRITSNDIVFEAMGSGRARQSVQLYPAVAEEVNEIYFKAGDKVQEGAVLVQLDDREEQLAVRLAEVKLKDAQSLLQRYQLAVKDGAVPESDVDSAKAAVEVAKVALDQAKLSVEERKIRAPFNGVLGIPRVDPGERVTPNTLIAGIDDRTILHVDFDVPEALAVELKKENTITAHTPAYPNRTFTGRIEALESRIDPQKRTIKTRASIQNDDDSLRPGMSFMTRLEVKGEEYPTVPEISIQWGRDGSFIWVVRGSLAKRMPVRIIARTSGDVLIESEVDDTDQVVVEGLQRLQPDLQVIVANTPKASGSSAVEPQS